MRADGVNDRGCGTGTGTSIRSAKQLGPALVLWVLAGCAAHPVLRGPLPVRNQHPAQLAVLHQDPAAAEVLPAARVRARADAAYTSLFLAGAGDGSSFQMDGEILRSGVKVQVGLGHGLQAHAELAAAHTTGGFLDGFLIGWHDFWGLPDQGRDAAPRDRFQVEARRQGTTVYAMQERDLELLDLPMGLQWTYLPRALGQPLALAARAAVEWPTGDEERGFGNGELDAALGLLAELRLGPAALTAHVDHTFAGARSFADVSVAGLGIELALTDTWTLLVQGELETSTLRDLGFARVADEQGLLWIGARARLSDRVALELALGEDLTGFVAPDFTAYLALSFE